MIDKLEVERLSSEPNAAVIRLPGRKFPGIVIQGDSLKILVDCVEDVSGLAERSGNLELQKSITELRTLLKSYMKVYEEALRGSGQSLPYAL
jgi:hypothetical protein